MSNRARFWLSRVAALAVAFWIGCSAADWADTMGGGNDSGDDLSSQPSGSPYGGYRPGYGGVGPAPAPGSDAYYGQMNQPRMASALEHLQNAHSELQQADTNKGGYRKDAIDHVEAAMEAVQNGMQYDVSH